MSALREGGADADHRQAFRAWLCLNLEEQYSDLEEFLAGLGGADRAETWMGAVCCEHLIPPGAPLLESELFRTDLEVIFELWRAHQRPQTLRPKPKSASGRLQRWIPQFRSDLR